MNLKGILFYQYAIYRFTLIVFWVILLGFLITGIILSLVFSNVDIFYNLNGTIYVFLAVMGFWSVKNVIPSLLKVGTNRKHTFLGLGLGLLMLVIVFTLLSNVIMILANQFLQLASNAGTNNFYNFIAFFMEDAIWLPFLIDFAISSLFVSISVLYGLIFYRYGLYGGFASLAVTFLIFIYGMSKFILSGLAENLAQYAISHSASLFSMIFLVAVAIYGLTYLLIRKIQVS